MTVYPEGKKTHLVLELLWIQNRAFAEIKPSLKVLRALVKHPLGVFLRSDTVLLIKTKNVVYLRITNALPLRAPAQPCLTLFYSEQRPELPP